MKVVVATGLYPPDIGGPATYTKMLEEELPRRGVVVTVVPFAVVRSHAKVLRHIIYLWRVWRAAKGADVIYALDPVSVGLPAALAAKLRRRPFLLRLGGDYAWEQGRERYGVTALLDEFVTTPQRGRVRLLQRLQTWTARQARQVVVPSRYLGSIVEQWGIDKFKIRVIYSVYKPLLSEQSKREARTALQLHGNVIYSVGRLVPWKGFSTLIPVVMSLHEEFPDIHLYIGGSGSQHEVLKEVIKTHRAHEYVTLLGRLDRDLSGCYKKAADVFILNTGYEGLSHDLLEAMAMGTPIVTTPVGGNPELITSEREGLLVPYNDEAAIVAAVRRLLTHPELCERLTKSARARTQVFTVEQSMDAIVGLLQSVHGHKT
ncbi:glycosyltransferase family 4 protein [Candidatus Kaiserbacteria bacterium]|nr:glycosyltransferase family 4 protein [Candidatus Kaiserbacteria bacterium]